MISLASGLIEAKLAYIFIPAFIIEDIKIHPLITQGMMSS